MGGGRWAENDQGSMTPGRPLSAGGRRFTATPPRPTDRNGSAADCERVPEATSHAFGSRQQGVTESTQHNHEESVARGRAETDRCRIARAGGPVLELVCGMRESRDVSPDAGKRLLHLERHADRPAYHVARPGWSAKQTRRRDFQIVWRVDQSE